MAASRLASSAATLLPGPTDTGFFEEAEMEDTRVGRGSKDDPATVARQGVEGMLDGKDKVEVHSLKARAQSVLAAILPERAKAAGVDKVVFDRGGFLYHGRVAAVAAAAREAGQRVERLAE